MVVQAIARQTFWHHDPERLAEIGSSMNALGMAQAILIESGARVAAMAEVVASALAPHVADGAIGYRIRLAGSGIALEGRRVHAFTLALHELATSAARCGALSVQRGAVDIEWLSAGGYRDFVWRERDRPACVTPERSGFGSFLITPNPGVALGGALELGFSPAGLTCRLRAPAT